MLSTQRYILLEMSVYSILSPLWKYLYAKTDEKIYPLSNSYLNHQKHWHPWVDLIKFNKCISINVYQFSAVNKFILLFFFFLKHWVLGKSVFYGKLENRRKWAIPVELCTVYKARSLLSCSVNIKDAVDTCKTWCHPRSAPPRTLLPGLRQAMETSGL